MKENLNEENHGNPMPERLPFLSPSLYVFMRVVIVAIQQSQWVSVSRCRIAMLSNYMTTTSSPQPLDPGS